MATATNQCPSGTASVSKLRQLVLGRQGTVRRDLINLGRDLVVGTCLTARIRGWIGVGRPLAALAADRRRSSDTVFILGSGASVADFGEADFAHMARHDSIGLNHWPLHDFVPSYLLFEASTCAQRVSALLDSLQQRAAQYSDVPLIIDYRSWCRFGTPLEDLPATLRDQVYLHAPWWLASIKPDHVRAGLKLWDHPWRRHLGDAWRLVHHRGGLATAVSFAYLAGYQQIVLAGVDLNDSRFFWEVDPERYKNAAVPPRTEQAGVHSSVDPGLSIKHHTLPMDDYLALFAETLLRPAGVTLYNLNPSSRLAGRLPLYRPFYADTGSSIAGIA